MRAGTSLLVSSQRDFNNESWNLHCQCVSDTYIFSDLIRIFCDKKNHNLTSTQVYVYCIVFELL